MCNFSISRLNVMIQKSFGNIQWLKSPSRSSLPRWGKKKRGGCISLNSDQNDARKSKLYLKLICSQPTMHSTEWACLSWNLSSSLTRFVVYANSAQLRVSQGSLGGFYSWKSQLANNEGAHGPKLWHLKSAHDEMGIWWDLRVIRGHLPPKILLLILKLLGVLITNFSLRRWKLH